MTSGLPGPSEPASPDRSYVFRPATPGAAGPPLLLLHGTGGDEHDLLPLGARLSPGGALLSVRGSVLENGMPRFLRRLREGVFDEDDLRQQTDALADFLRTAGDHHGVPPASLIAVGFSNGANIASALLLRHPGLLAGAVLLSAMVPFTEPRAADLNRTMVIISNGDRDPMIPAELTRRLAAQLRERGADVTELPHHGGHQIDPTLVPRISELITHPGA